MGLPSLFRYSLWAFADSSHAQRMHSGHLKRTQMKTQHAKVKTCM